MSVIVRCDRCHDVVDKDSIKAGKRGYVIYRDYCPKCAEIIDEMYLAIDTLHDSLSEKFEKGLKKIRAKYAIEGGELPDVQT